jgi:protein phosphatase
VVSEHLVQLANEHGGRDNVSVQLAQVVDSFAAKKGLLAKLSGLFGS